MTLSGAAVAVRPGTSEAQQAGSGSVTPDKLLLKDYRPESIYKIPRTDIRKAKFPIVDVHNHPRSRTPADVAASLKIMDAVGVEKTVLFCGTGARFDELHQLYSKHPDRFALWCGLDLTDGDKPGFGPATIKELERCHAKGAVGVGEVTDKGRGLGVRIGTGPVGWPGRGAPSTAMSPHPDDPRVDPIWRKCAQLGMPVNIHVSDPIWSYQPQDATNDGLMNGFTWRLDDKPGILGHEGLIESLERMLKKHPRTVYIACHFANLDYDLARLGQLFDRNPNLYADISARFAETAPIPRFASRFFQKYPNRLLYGTDMNYTQRMFSTTFRILESLDEHFYENDLNFNFDYHWPLHGFGLPDKVLKKVYGENAKRVLQSARSAG